MSIPYYHKLKKVINKHNLEIKNCNVFIETGLYIGETISDLYFDKYLDDMSKVYSIEIEKHFIDECIERFPFLKDNKFNLVHGDSASELTKICHNHKDDKMFFWLDAHYSGGPTGKSGEYGECPIKGELDFLKDIKEKPIIVIDDIALFGVQKDFPKIESIIEKINSFDFDFDITIDEELSVLVAI
jgi:hypothetical protein